MPDERQPRKRKATERGLAAAEFFAPKKGRPTMTSDATTPVTSSSTPSAVPTPVSENPPVSRTPSVSRVPSVPSISRNASSVSLIDTDLDGSNDSDSDLEVVEVPAQPEESPKEQRGK